MSRTHERERHETLARETGSWLSWSVQMWFTNGNMAVMMRTLGATHGRSKNTVGRVREKLAALLRQQGFEIDAFDLRWSDGQNSHATEDTYRWDGYATACGRADCPPLPPGVKVYLHSWDTMSLCTRVGILAVEDDIPWSYEIHAIGML